MFASVQYMAKRAVILAAVFVLVFGFTANDAQATSGACSGHGGVSCSAGRDYDGSVVCNDGWRNSSVGYSSMAMCQLYTAPTKAKITPSQVLPTKISTTKVPAPIITPPSNTYYKNVDGVSVHSPVYSLHGIPAGATAKCKDTTYSFSLHRSGTCSGHRGVSQWLN